MYGIYIISLIIFICLISILYSLNASAIRELFEEKDYNDIMKENINSSCVKLLKEKKLFNDDNTKVNNDRKNILADMDVARYPESYYNNILYRAKNACVLRKDAITTYYNNDAVNLIDDNCRLRGVSVDNVPIEYQMKKTEDGTLPHNGCEIDWNEMTKDDVNALLDKFYNVKMYPVLNESKNKTRALTNLQEINIGLLQQNTLLEEKLKEMSQYVPFGKMNIDDSIKFSCRQAETNWMPIIDENNPSINSYKTLDKHEVKCKAGEVLSQFKYEQAGDKDRYSFKCCKVDTSPISNKLKENRDSFAQQGSFNSAGDFGNIIMLTNNGAACIGDNNNRKFLSEFQMRTKANGSLLGDKQVIDPNRYETKTDYLCTNFEVNGIPSKRVETTCNKYTTKKNAPPTGTSVSVLTHHNVKCPLQNEALVDFAVANDGENIYYNFTCCEPKLVDINAIP